MTEHPADRRDLRRWPASPAHLIDTTLCPACFSVLGSAVCAGCGLDLSVPAAAGLLGAGRRVFDDEVARQSLITSLRAAQAVRVRAVATGAAAVATPAAPTPAAPAPVAPTPAAPPSGRSGVQVLLLTLGVVLISITAIVFLFVAYLVASLEVRSVIIAVASVAVLGVAWLLRARRLPGTAEGVASVAIVLLLLDVWIVRANALFGTDAIESAAYTGGALLIVAVALVGVRAASGIRVTGFAAAVLAPVGVFLLASEAAPDDQLSTPFLVGLLAVSLLGSVAVLLPAMVERVIVMAAGFFAAALAFLPAYWAVPEVAWSQLWEYLAVAAAWLIALVAVRRRRAMAPAWGQIAAPAFGLALALAPSAAIFRELADEPSLWLAPAAAGLVASVLAVGTRLQGSPARDAFAAGMAAVLVAGGSAVPGAFLGLGAIGSRLAASVPAWGLDVAQPLSSAAPDHDLAVVLVPFVVSAGALVVTMLLRRARGLAAIPAGAAFAGGITAAAVSPGPGIAAAVLLVLAAAALAIATRRLAIPGLLTVLAAAGVASSGLAWWVGYSSSPVWPWAVALVIVLTVAGRVLAVRVWPATTAPAIGAAHLAIASTLVASAVFSIPLWVEAGFSPLVAAWSSPWMWLATVAAALLVAAVFVGVGSAVDRLAAVVPLFAASVVSIFGLAFEADASLRWLPAALFVAAGVLWLRLGTPTALRVAFAAVAPIALAFGSAVVVDLVFGPEFIGIGLAGAALLAAALAHVVPPRADPTRAVWAMAVGLIGLTALVSGLSGPFSVAEPWLVLLLLTPVPLVIAALDGDPIGGDRPLRHLSWLSLGLGVATVWTWLLGDGVDDVEAYTLPLAAALAVTGGLITWRRTAGTAGTGARGGPRAADGRTALFGSAAAVAVLPSVGMAGDSELRTLVLVAIGIIVAIAASFLPEVARGVPVRLLGVLTGWVAFTGAALVRGSAVASGAVAGDSVLFTEFWPLIALVAGAAIALIWARTASRPAWPAEVLLAASIAFAAVPTLVAIVSDDAPLVRAAVLFPALALVHIASAATTARPIAGAGVGWTTLGVLAVGGTIALASGHVDPFDLVTASLGVALLGAGVFRMRRSPELGSWPALGPGLAVLLVPPLAADFTDPELWRIVTLGVVAVVAVVVGATRRLQAPLLLGGAVLLAHALVQLWPWITALYDADWWWLWLGVAGVLLVVLAATYERQLRLARGTIRSIAALR